MNTGYKMSLAFVALLLVIGMSASASRMGMSRHASAAEADSSQQEAMNDSENVAPGSVVDEVIWVVGDEAILKSDVEVTRLQGAILNFKTKEEKMKTLTRNCINWTKSILEKNHQTKVVIGISGGKDSSVVAAICAKAIDPENVIVSGDYTKITIPLKGQQSRIRTFSRWFDWTQYAHQVYSRYLLLVDDQA